MAHARGNHRRRRHDGALLCTLCVDTRPREDNEWCAVAESIVCEDCCRGLMMGEERVLMAVAESTGHDVEPEDLIEICTSCPRLIRIVSEDGMDAGPEVRLPMH